jgi:hypothetical protein
MASYASTPGDGTSNTASMRDGAFGTLNTIGEKFKDNETVSGLVTGTYLDDAKTRLNTASAVDYNNAMQESTFKYNDALRNADVGRASQLMAAEGGVTRDLMGTKGDEDRKSLVTTGEQQRLGLEETGKQNRMTQDNTKDNAIALRNDARSAVDRSFQHLYG